MTSRTSWLRLASKRSSSVSDVIADAFRGKLQEVANLFTDRGSTGFACNQERHVGDLQAGSEQTHLGGFSTALRAFESDERQAWHVVDFQAKHAACRIFAVRLNYLGKINF